MITNSRIIDQYTKKNDSYLSIIAIFNPSLYEQYECLIKLKKPLRQKEWAMSDLCISNPKNDQYETIMSLYSEQVLKEIKEEVLNQLVAIKVG
ncbi:MAG: hypothetical protein ACQEWV_22650 [Bacillota bacterium]